MKKRFSLWSKIVLIALFVIVVVAGGFTFLIPKISYQADNTAIEMLKSDEYVEVKDGEFLSFSPIKKAETGFIFYPGGLVEPEAYAPLARKIAEEGYYVAIVPMRWNLAIMSPNRAKMVIRKNPQIKNWYIGGHSLGGVMAAQFAESNDFIKGIVLYASYPQGNILEESDKKVLSMYGSNDGVAVIEKVTSAKLGKDAELVTIEGGNHCFFGNYGMQKGDNEGTITREEQQKSAVDRTALFLSEE